MQKEKKNVKNQIISLTSFEEKIVSEDSEEEHSWLHNLRQWLELSSVQLFRTVVNRVRNE